MKTPILIIGIAAILSQAVLADDIKDADVMVRQTVGSVLAVLRNKSLGEGAKREQILEIVRPVFDFGLMAKLTLGKKYWSRLAGDEKQEFTSLLVERLENSYIEKIELFTDETVEFELPKKVKKNKIHVETWVISKDGRISIKYKLYKKSEDWRVYDVEIEDVSIISAYRSQYHDVLRSGTIKDLLEKMRRKDREADSAE